MALTLFTDIVSVSSFWDKTNFKSPLAKILDGLGFAKKDLNYEIAKSILEKHGQNSLDYFKLSKDKSFYFSKSNRSFLAYRILGRSAMVLGDPVGPDSEIETLINHFHHVCKGKNQNLCFFQASPSFLNIYKKLDFHISTIGNEGLVNLPNFDLKNPNRTELREQMRTLDAFRYKVRYYKNPTDKVVLQKLQNVSNDWPGGTTTVMTVEDMVCNIVAFITVIPSYKKNDLGIDLIRQSKTAPEGTLEYLLTHTILFFKELGYQRLSLGLIPLSTSQAKPSFEEAVAKALLAKMSFLFRDINLKPLKEKFIDILEPRYFTSSKQQKAAVSKPNMASIAR